MQSSVQQLSVEMWKSYFKMYFFQRSLLMGFFSCRNKEPVNLLYRDVYFSWTCSQEYLFIYFQYWALSPHLHLVPMSFSCYILALFCRNLRHGRQDFLSPIWYGDTQVRKHLDAPVDKNSQISALCSLSKFLLWSHSIGFWAKKNNYCLIRVQCSHQIA